jgi:hypothetical protein
VLPGDGALIGGFIITGSNNARKQVIIRGIGPSLTAFGVQGALANPTLDLYDSYIGFENPPLRSNDDWITNRAEVQATGIPPNNDLESAIVYATSPGAFTTVLSGKDNGSGIGVVEVYDLNSDENAILANISSRAFVGAGDSSALIAGFIIGGSGTGPSRVVVRGIGPSLRPFGIAAPLQDPTLELRNANGTTLKSNDDWQQSTDAAEIGSRGLAPTDTHESALVISLTKGNYTAIVRGVDGGTGIGLVDVYDVE